MKRLLVKVLVGALLLVILITISYAGFILANFNGVFPYTYYRKEGDILPTGKIQNFHFDKFKTKMTPIEFLDCLEYKKGGPTYCRVWDLSYDHWVKKTDARILASRLASEKPCVVLQEMTSSAPVDVPMKEGYFAFRLLCGYLDDKSSPPYEHNPCDIAARLTKEKIQYPPIETWCINSKSWWVKPDSADQK